MINTNFAASFVPSFATRQPAVIGFGCLCTIPALNMASCALKDLNELLTPEKSSERVLNNSDQSALTIKQSEFRARQIKIRQELTSHAIGAVVLGACAANVFPGSAFIGTIGFTLFANFAFKREMKMTHTCLTTLYTGAALKILGQFKGRIAKALAHKLMGVAKGVSKLFHRISRFVLKAIRGGIKIAKLPLLGFIRHPFIGTVLLGVSLVVIGKHHVVLNKGLELTAALTGTLAKGLFTAGAFLAKGTVKVLGSTTVFTFSLLLKPIKATINVARFILRI